MSKQPKTRKVTGEIQKLTTKQDAELWAKHGARMQSEFPILDYVLKRTCFHEWALTCSQKTSPRSPDRDINRPAMFALEKLLRAEGAKPGYIPVNRSQNELHSLVMTAVGRWEEGEKKAAHAIGAKLMTKLTAGDLREWTVACKGVWQQRVRGFTRLWNAERELIEELRSAPVTRKAKDSGQKAS